MTSYNMADLNVTCLFSWYFLDIIGVPLIMGVFDWNSIKVNWEAARLVPVNKPVVVDVDPSGAPPAEILSRVMGKHRDNLLFDNLMDVSSEVE